MFTALIPARGGSRGVPRKNLCPVGAKPMIAWTIEAALRAESVARVIVTTDDVEIADVSRAWGAEVPFLRPAPLGSDEATSVSVVSHALECLRAQGEAPEAVAFLQPTSPLRQNRDIDAAAAVYRSKAAHAVVSVKPVSHPLAWLRRISPEGELLEYTHSGVARRQDSDEELYELNGAIYLFDVGAFDREQTFFPERTFAFVMPPERSLDIDTQWDLKVADLLMREKHAN